MTVVYGPEDALYGTGRYGVARYGSVGPTKQVTGVAGTLQTGTLGTTGKANKTLEGQSALLVTNPVQYSAAANRELQGQDLFFTTGEPSVRSVNRILVEGVSSILNLGTLSVFGGTGYTAAISGLNLTTNLGRVKPNLLTRVSGVALTVDVGNITAIGKAIYRPQSQKLSIKTLPPTITATQFDYEQFADNYSRKRAIYMSKSSVVEEVV